MPRALGLDLGRTCGWTLAHPEYLRKYRPRLALEGPRPSYAGMAGGEWPLGDEADYDALYAALWCKLEGLHADTPLTHVFYEASGGNFKSEAAVWIQIGLAAVVRLWARLYDLEAELVNNSRVKAHACHGRATKDDMEAAALDLGYETKGEHHADSFFVLDYKLQEWHGRR